MSKPRTFIASSSDHLDLAESVQANLEYDSHVEVWTQDVVVASARILDSLIRQIETTDFAVFICAPSDFVRIQGEEYHIVRDNVIFELGLFIGRLGPERSYLIIPRNSKKSLHLPSDLQGVEPLTYDDSHHNIVSSLAVPCRQIKERISSLGMKKRFSEPTLIHKRPLCGEGVCILKRKTRIVSAVEKYEGFTLVSRENYDQYSPLKIAAFGPHVDDIELGCGATLAKLIDRYQAVLYYFVFSGSSLTWDGKRAILANADGRINDAKRAFKLLVTGKSDFTQTEERAQEIKIHSADGAQIRGYFRYETFDDGKMDKDVERIRQIFRELQTTILSDVDIIFMPSFKDVHQDHKIVGNVALEIFRKQENILFYSSPDSGKHPNLRFNPNIYFDVSQPVLGDGVYCSLKTHTESFISLHGGVPTYADVKLNLLDIFKTEKNKPWYKRLSFVTKMVNDAEDAYLPTPNEKEKFAEGFEGILRL
ncbi:MAG: TIR domain-containing protein [Desulfobacterales bacterium]